MRAVDITGRPVGIFGRRGTAGVRGMVAVGREHGVDARTLLAGSGVTPEEVDDPAAVVRGSQELVVARNLVRACPRPGLGVDVGSRLRLRHYGVWGFALMASPTLGVAAEVGLPRLALTYATAGVSLRVAGGEVRMQVDDSGVPAAVRDFVVERELASIRGIVGGLLGEPVPLLRIDLRRPPTPGLFGDVPVSFGAPRDALVASTSVLDRALPQADPRTMRACARECDLLLLDRLDGPVAGRVRELFRIDGTVIDMDTAAARLHMSPRTLRRRLAAEGTSFHRVAAEARHAAAVELLTTTRLGLSPIALRLGYSDASTFTRAFRRWTGVTPGTYRANIDESLSIY
ncbi:AraC family transcriptional regulator [Saccharothrix sp.]|uniref:AraC family transcriptional regulator n=1 Tax=Saccharothrix sp. TaxID=1873460 RepID=UPI002811E536|nr:AraC family transcriptional regulator [Saccharothrix sp.]